MENILTSCIILTNRRLRESFAAGGKLAADGNSLQAENWRTAEKIRENQRKGEKSREKSRKKSQERTTLI